MDIEFISANKRAYYTASEAQGYYGVPRSMQTIVIHHWNSPDQRPNFGGNLSYLLNPANGYPSANCVIGYDEATNRVRIVDTVRYPDVAFTSGGSINAKSVAIECDPLAETNHPRSAEIYKAIGFRVYKWRSDFGWRVPLSRHSDWFGTACPGNMDLARIDQEADKWANGGYNPQPAPQPKFKFTRYATPQTFLTNQNPTSLWIFNVDKWPDFKAQSTFDVGKQITIVGETKHPLGSVYMMTAYSFGSADTTGTPDHYWGFNSKDLTPYTPPAPTTTTTTTTTTSTTTTTTLPPDLNLPANGEDALSWLKRIWVWVQSILSKFRYQR